MDSFNLFWHENNRKLNNISPFHPIFRKSAAQTVHHELLSVCVRSQETLLATFQRIIWWNLSSFYVYEMYLHRDGAYNLMLTH